MSINKHDYVLGEYANKKHLPPLVWNPDSREASNQHGLIVGKSGSGKTSTLIHIVEHLHGEDKHIYVFDFKGDLKFRDKEGNIVGNYIEFTAWDSEYGLNIFEFDYGITPKELKEIIDSGKELTSQQSFAIRNAGPKVQITRIIELIKKNFLSAMGNVQSDMLYNLLRDTYILNGFVLKDYTTWLSPLPTLDDLLGLIDAIRECLSGKGSGEDHLSQDFIRNLKTHIVGVGALEKRLQFDDEVAETKAEITSKIEQSKNKINEIFDEYCREAKSRFTPDDIEKYNPAVWLELKGISLSDYNAKNSLPTLEQLYSYLNRLRESEVFNDNPIPVKPGLNVFNLSGLDHDVKRFFSDISIGKIFRACKLRGDYKDRKNKSRGEKVDTYAVIDETETLAGDEKEKKDPFSFLNIIAKESRSIGFGLLVAAQSPKHFPHEFLRNFHLQIVLEMNNSKSELEIASKAFGIDSGLVDYTMQGFGNALVKKGAVFEKIKLEAIKRIEQKLENMD